MRRRELAAILVVVAACQSHDKDTRPTRAAGSAWGAGAGSGSGSGSAVPPRGQVPQVAPKLDLKAPPPDAITTTSGLIFKLLGDPTGGPTPQRNDSVVVRIVAWKQSTGETFNATPAGKGTVMGLPSVSPGFAEGLQRMHRGETAMLWIPPQLGYVRAPTSGAPETLVYEVELMEIQPAPPTPPDLAKPPATAGKLAMGAPFVVAKPGTGKDKPRAYDTVTFDYTGWDVDGRVLMSTEIVKRSVSTPLYKQTPLFEQALGKLTVGGRARLWATAEELGPIGKSLGSPPGVSCWEVQLAAITPGHAPPPVPADVAAPPATATKTPKGVAYVVLAPGTGTAHPQPTDRAKVHYTGWRAEDGRMFESTIVRDEPTSVAVNAPPVSGWTELLPLLVVGERVRAWVPAELAYKGAPSRPQGMLVFELELLDITAGPPPNKTPPRPREGSVR